MSTIYRIAVGSDWEKAQRTGWFESADLALEGFIHFAERSQVQGVYERYYRGQLELMVLAVDDAFLGAALKRENTRGGSELFPHMYGPVPLKAIQAHWPVHVDSQGGILWPQGM